MRQKGAQFTHLISVSSKSCEAELRRICLVEDPQGRGSLLVVPAGATLSDVESFLVANCINEKSGDAGKQIPAFSTSMALLDMLGWFGSKQIRNVAVS